jgi:hypothetical protein
MTWKLSRSAMTLVMLALFLIFVGFASTYPAQARFMPYVVGFPAIALCLLQLWMDYRDRRTAPEQSDGRSEFEKAEDNVSRMIGRKIEFDVAHSAMPSEGAELLASDAGSTRREIVLWGCFLGFIFGILLFGFWIAIPVFLVTFLRFQANASWRFAIILTVVATAILYGMFDRVLRVQLHPGFVTEAILDKIAG